jgi:large subunit ribosomal protein L6
MSRIAKSPVSLPAGVAASIKGNSLEIKGTKGVLNLSISPSVDVVIEDNEIKCSSTDSTKHSHAMSGTIRSLINNMVVGVASGFEKKLQLVGVGYRAQAGAKSINLSLGFSHPIEYTLPEGIIAETPTQTEIVIKGIDKQQVGQVAAEIRAFRPPEPYKGKGVRYADENVRRKEAKKK